MTGLFMTRKGPKGLHWAGFGRVVFPQQMQRKKGRQNESSQVSRPQIQENAI